eukprot:gene15064-17829_t
MSGRKKQDIPALKYEDVVPVVKIAGTQNKTLHELYQAQFKALVCGYRGGLIEMNDLVSHLYTLFGADAAKRYMTSILDHPCQEADLPDDYDIGAVLIKTKELDDKMKAVKAYLGQPLQSTQQPTQQQARALVVPRTPSSQTDSRKGVNLGAQTFETHTATASQQYRAFELIIEQQNNLIAALQARQFGEPSLIDTEAWANQTFDSLLNNQLLDKDTVQKKVQTYFNSMVLAYRNNLITKNVLKEHLDLLFGANAQGYMTKVESLTASQVPKLSRDFNVEAVLAQTQQLKDMTIQLRQQQQQQQQPAVVQQQQQPANHFNALALAYRNNVITKDVLVNHMTILFGVNNAAIYLARVDAIPKEKVPEFKSTHSIDIILAKTQPMRDLIDSTKQQQHQQQQQSQPQQPMEEKDIRTLGEQQINMATEAKKNRMKQLKMRPKIAPPELWSNSTQSFRSLLVPPHVLKSIIDNLDHNQDRVCFIMVCKRWYAERDLYLSFNIVHSQPVLKSHIQHLTHQPNATSLVNQLKESYFDMYRAKDNNQDKALPTTHMVLDELKRGAIPAQVTHITLGDKFNQSIKGMLPQHITQVTFGDSFDVSLQAGDLPNGITHLSFGSKYDQPFERNVLPQSLTHLTIGDKFNHPFLSDSLPRSLVSLRVTGPQFNQKLNTKHLPQSLTSLFVGKGYNCGKINEETFPNSSTVGGEGSTAQQDIQKQVQNHFNALALSYRNKALDKERLMTHLLILFGQSNSVDYMTRIENIDPKKIPRLPSTFNVEEILSKTQQLKDLIVALQQKQPQAKTARQKAKKANKEPAVAAAPQPVAAEQKAPSRKTNARSVLDDILGGNKDFDIQAFLKKSEEDKVKNSSSHKERLATHSKMAEDAKKNRLKQLKMRPKEGLAYQHKNEEAIRQFTRPLSATTIVNQMKDCYFGAYRDIENNKPHTVIPRNDASITKLRMGVDFKQKLTPGCFPASVTDLTFDRFNDTIGGPGCLPVNLTHLTIDGFTNNMIHKGDLPPKLTHFTFGPQGYIEDNHVIQQKNNIPAAYVGIFPPTLTHLTFGNAFDQLLTPGVIPPTVTHLDLGGYNSRISRGDIPNSVTHLTFGSRFNREIDVGALPVGLQTLYFGNSFNMPIREGVLPPTLTRLYFGKYFNDELSRAILPASLVHLTIGEKYKQTLTAANLPLGLTSLDVSYGFLKHLKANENTFPKSLEHLGLANNVVPLLAPGILPKTITSLTYYNDIHKTDMYKIIHNLIHRGITVNVLGFFNSYRLRLMDKDWILCTPPNDIYFIRVKDLERLCK